VTRFFKAVVLCALALAVVVCAGLGLAAWFSWSIDLPMPWAFLVSPFGPLLIAIFCLLVWLVYEDLKP
jgi:uncharacterized membrane protein YczE